MASIDTMLPERGAGFLTYNREAGGKDQYGTRDTINAIIAAGLQHAKMSTVPFAVGDISRKGGGAFPPHAEHRKGTDFDVRPLRKDGTNAPCEVLGAQYSRERTRTAMQAIRAAAFVDTIFFNDAALISEGLCKPATGHDNHFHVRLAGGARNTGDNMRASTTEAGDTSITDNGSNLVAAVVSTLLLALIASKLGS
jgi:murein endopeptidase